VTLKDSHVTGNEANGAAGQGGGLKILGAAVTLSGTRVTGNTAANGGGIYSSGGAVTIEPESVTGNTPNNCAGDAVGNCVN
jgi:predicted outer membrane repeat protein